MGFSDLFSTVDVILDADPGNKAGLLELLAAEAAQRFGQSADDILAALKARENIGSTALGKGIALPHAEMRDAETPLVLFARLSRPIGFDAGDDQPVDLVFMMLWPATNRKGLLTAMAEVCRVLRDPQSLRRLRAASTAEEVVQAIRDAAAEQDGYDTDMTADYR